MNWWVKPFFIAILALSTLQVHGQESESLVGIWQDMPSLGSGWSDNYRFFEDGSFVFSHNQMNCEDSIISMGGFYKLRKKKIVLTFIVMEYISGGELVPSSGSCGSEFSLVGGEHVSDSCNKKLKLSISKIQPDPEFDHLVFILIDNVKYWKLSWDPNEY